MDKNTITTNVIAIIIENFEIWHSVEALAKKVGLTELQLQNLFKEVHGKTVGVYARELRLKHAHKLLEQHDYPLRVICGMVGYPDPSNFSFAYLRQFGCRPGVTARKKTVK